MSDDRVRTLLVRFLDDLEAIGERHEEVYDTDVRERLGERIEELFVARARGPELDLDLGMFSPEGNELVGRALLRFLTAAVEAGGAISDPTARRAAVWDADATSTSGASVDEFLGWPD